jgi:hypothetical protein
MKTAEPPSEKLKGVPLTPEQRREGEKNMAHLLIVAHDQGVPAAIEELRRLRAEKRAKAQNSPAA